MYLPEAFLICTSPAFKRFTNVSVSTIRKHIMAEHIVLGATLNGLVLRCFPDFNLLNCARNRQLITRCFYNVFYFRPLNLKK